MGLQTISKTRQQLKGIIREVVEAQLVERSLPTHEIRGSNPVLGKLYIPIYCQLHWKDENKEKEAGNGQFFKKDVESREVVRSYERT